MRVDLHKKVRDHGQNINRMPIWGIRTSYCSYKKPPSSKYRGQSVFKYIHNF